MFFFKENIHKVKPIPEIAEIVKKYYNIIVSAEDVQNHKPHPDTFLKCAELMGVKPESCQVFEDGDMGLIAAEKAGMIVTDVRLFL